MLNLLVLLLGAFMAARDAGWFRDNLVAIAEDAGSFDIFLGLLDAAGFREMLSGDVHYTLFAPTDEAFGRLARGRFQALRHDPDALREMILYHLAEGDYSVSDIAQTPAIPTLSGKVILVKTAGQRIRLNASSMVEPGSQASNGFFHVLEDVLIPTGDTPLNDSPTAAFVDLDRFQGTWYRILGLAAKGEDKCAARSVEVRLDGDVLVFVTFCQILDDSVPGSALSVSKILRKVIRTEISDLETNARFMIVRDLPGGGQRVFSESLILAIDEDYQWAIMGTRDRKYVSVLARDKNLPPTISDQLIDIVARRGYGSERLVKLPAWLDVPASTPVEEGDFY